MTSDYRNHDVALHRRIVRDAALCGGNALDVGYGDGLLLARLTAVCRCAIGLETNGRIAARARRYLEQTPQAGVLLDDITDLDLPQYIGTFETVTYVATLHHLPLELILVRLGQPVAPGGRLIIVGLVANKNPWDWTLSTLAALPLHMIGAPRRESSDIDVVTRAPQRSLTEIRRAVARLLPGARIRQHFYCRYTLIRDHPTEGS